MNVYDETHDPREHGHHNKLPATGLACRANEAGSMSFMWTYPIAWSTDKAGPSVAQTAAIARRFLPGKLFAASNFHPMDGHYL